MILSIKQIIFAIVGVQVLLWAMTFDGNELVFLPQHNIPRLVISMSTFSTRIQVNALKTIDLLLKGQEADSFIITVGLSHRNLDPNITCHYNDCMPEQNLKELKNETEILYLFQEKFGKFDPVHCSSLLIHRSCYSCGKIYLQFLHDFDWGPATKLLGALLVERDSDTVLVTMDDDCDYSNGLAKKLAQRLPRRSVLGTSWQSVSIIDESAYGVFVNLQKELMLHYRVASVLFDYENYGLRHFDAWLMGVGAVAYRVNYFEADIWTYAQNVSPQCFYNDDVWVAGYLRKKFITVYSVFILALHNHHRHPTASLSVIPHSQSTAGSWMMQCALQNGFF
jgi:hypothetical protein